MEIKWRVSKWECTGMLKISLIDHITNMEVLRRVNKERELLTNLIIGKTAYFGHGDKIEGKSG